MSCSIRRFKSDSCPEKPINTENAKQLKNDLEKMLEERNKMDNKYYSSGLTITPKSPTLIKSALSEIVCSESAKRIN